MKSFLSIEPGFFYETLIMKMMKHYTTKKTSAIIKVHNLNKCSGKNI